MPGGAWRRRTAALVLVAVATAAPVLTTTATAAEQPPAPLVGLVQTAPGGVVRVPVEAAAGTTIEVRAGRRLATSAYAPGGVQWLSFQAPTGTRRYRVTATDLTGATSDPVALTVTADATPPAVRRLRVHAATPADSRTRVRLSTDRGTSYTLTVDGLPVAARTTRGGSIDEAMALPDGTHRLALRLVDEAGNERLVTRAFEVAVPALDVSATAQSGPTDRAQVFGVLASPGAVATVKVQGSDPERVRLTAGAGRATFDLADGRYPAPRVRVVDAAGRRGTTRLEPFVVDTTPPRLVVDSVESEPTWSARVTAEPGSRVAWQVSDGAGDVLAHGGFTTDGTREPVAADLDEGSYRVRVTAEDAVGNTTSRTLKATVKPVGLTTGDVVAAGGSVLVLAFVLGLLSLLASAHRQRSAARRERQSALAAAREEARRREEAARRHAAEVAAHQARLVDYEAALLVHDQQVAAWEQRRAHLADLVERARLDRGIRPSAFSAVKLRAWEQVYCTVPGSMVEVRVRQGANHLSVVDDGDVTVTSERVVFNGTRRREWPLGRLEAMEHVGTDRTMMKVSTRKTWSGVTYGDPGHTRLCIALAAADQSGSRDDVVAVAERDLAAHDDRRPVPPGHPGPPPAAPAHGAGQVLQPELEDAGGTT